MHYLSITYTSLAALDLTAEQVHDIHQSAEALNGVDGISGILIFNGTHFLQIIEGPPDAVRELLERIRRDPRHSGIEIRDERMVDERLFGGWLMRLVRVRSRYTLAQEDVIAQLPEELSPAIRDRILSMIGQISEDVGS
ncbi:BLUF domain-containing protein [Sphingomonas humi]